MAAELAYMIYLVLVENIMMFIMHVITIFYLTPTLFTSFKNPASSEYSPPFLVYLCIIKLSAFIGFVNSGYIICVWWSGVNNGFIIYVTTAATLMFLPLVSITVFFLLFHRIVIITRLFSNFNIYRWLMILTFIALIAVTCITVAWYTWTWTLVEQPAPNNCWSVNCVTRFNGSILTVWAKLSTGFFNTIIGTIFVFVVKRVNRSKGLTTAEQNKRKKSNNLALFTLFSEIMFNFIPYFCDIFLRYTINFSLTYYLGVYGMVFGALDGAFVSLVYSNAFRRKKNLKVINSNGAKSTVSAITPANIPEDHIKSIRGIIQRKNPEIVEEIFLEKSQLFSCLEALGCHGLINCSTGMVQLIEAVLYETIKLQEKIKSILSKIKEMQKQKFLHNSPSKASHQRQLSLKLSEIYDRLKQNEAIETVIIEIVTNPRLESLLRIVRKRVSADRTLINVFNSYNNTKPDGFQICEVNPIVAKLIVIFQNAYKQLTSLIPISDDENNGNDGNDENVEENCNDDTVTDESLMDKEALSEGSSICVSSSFHGQVSNHPQGIISTNPRWITLSIYSSPDEIQQLLDRFTNLYYHQKDEILKTLNGLKEFKGLKELQIKTMLSVVVLTYRSVFDATQAQYNQIYKTLEMDNDFDDLMDYSIYRIMYRQAKNNHGIKNAKDVTTQIWETLFDFPSLKTCTRFNRFILDCVDVIWDIVAGVDGRMPRMRLDYECAGMTFDPTRYIRSSDSCMDSEAIKYCIWPGLISIHDCRYMIKAIMCT